MNNSDKQQYVCGFLWEGDSVVLVKKNRPAWQARKWNGVGGHIEPGENRHQAMTREFEEETGWHQDSWQHFCTNAGPDYEVHFFVWIAYDPVKVESKTDEVICKVHRRELNPGPYNDANVPLIPNLHWLLPMSRFAWNHTHTSGNRFEASVTEVWGNIPAEPVKQS